MPVRIEADYLLETAFDPASCRRGDGRRAVERHLRRGPRRDAGAESARRRPGRGARMLMRMSESRRCRLPQPRRARRRRGAGRSSRSPGRSTTSARRFPTCSPRSPATCSSSSSSPGCACSTSACRTRSRPPIPGRSSASRARAGSPGVEGPADRHDRQAERRLRPGGDGRAGQDAVRGRHRLHQGRRAPGRRARLPVRRRARGP